MGYFLVFGAISLLILLHETGHFLAAKWVGIPIARFSIGFGRRVWGFSYGNTEYRVSLIPCGGYVLPDIADERSFFLLPLRKRIVFALGGPLLNVLGAVLCVSVVNIGQHGVSLDAALIHPLKQTWLLASQIAIAIPALFSRPEQLSGIVGIVAMGGTHVGVSLYRLLELCAVLNVNLAVFNLLPVPPLDGGKVVMGVFERMYAPTRRLELPLALVGWVAMIALMLYATALDISRIAQSVIA